MSDREDYKIYVGNLAYDVTEREVRQYFEKFGDVDEGSVTHWSVDSYSNHIRIVIGQLSQEVYEYLEELEQMNWSARVFIATDRYTRRPRGYCFVTFRDSDDAKDAIHSANNTQFAGREINVHKALPKRSSRYDDRKRRRSPSPQRRSRSPRRKSRSPRQKSSKSPRRRSSGSPRRQSNSPKRRSPSPKRRSNSPARRSSSGSPRRKSTSPS